jgi:hypothetical protein
MSVDDVMQALAAGGQPLPQEAMRQALERWPEVAPLVLARFDDMLEGRDESDGTANVVFFGIHLAAQKRDERIYPPLCRLAMDAERADRVLGDAITTTLRQVLASVFDGDPGPLQALIEAPDAEMFARSAAVETLAYLGATGRIPRPEAEAYLARIHPLAADPEAGFFTLGWATAVAYLGVETLVPDVRRLFDTGLIDPVFMSFKDFQEELKRTLADPARMAGFPADQFVPLDDAIGELQSWHGFAEAPTARSAELPGWLPPAPLFAPAIDPYKGVGRNDPCPCGSGKKFKKCCLP